MSTTLGHVPSSTTPSPRRARGTNLQNDSPVQNEMDEIAKQKASQNALVDKTLSDKGKAKEPESANEPDSQEIEESFLAALLSPASSDHDRARDLIASLITQCAGEYIFRVGSRPPLTQLFAGELVDDADGWTGVARTEAEIDLMVDKITAVVEEVGGKTSVLFRVSGPRCRASLLLRLPPLSVAQTPEVRCAVVGNVDSGKSTTLGVLTRGALDDGRGRARVGLFRHKHEVESGRTSSILGFGPSGKPILPSTANSTDLDVIRREKLGWEEISLQAAKIVSFSDLAGHERYLKTTLYGLTSGAPSCVILTVGGNAGLIGMSKEHLAIALALGVPIVVCITKVDMTPANVLAETIKQVVKILKSPGCRKTPVFVKSVETAVEISAAFGKDRLCPIFLLSNVTGEGLDFVRTFLNLLPSSEADHEKFPVNAPLEFCVTEVWSVPYVGTVTNGIINAGVLKAGDAILFGPDANGNFQSTAVKTMQRKRADVTRAEAGQCVSLALKRVRRAAIRKGMVIVHKDTQPKGTRFAAERRLEGQKLLYYKQTTASSRSFFDAHCGRRQGLAKSQISEIGGSSMRLPPRMRTQPRITSRFGYFSHRPKLKLGAMGSFRRGMSRNFGFVLRLCSANWLMLAKQCGPRTYTIPGPDED
ncbi:GTP-binding protein 1 [Mycena kentingensis (nom. inval.)]|nr:GTP-binding protein 1 [Mycena kentingensis (nom. inval.)]